ncbi:DUF6043 family protein [Barnesiella intestinihominis]|uniref:DUF6043 family protein n=1 Tax=Barnesiella intestinihominis TaxID=487174 RepID=UPI003966F01D
MNMDEQKLTYEQFKADILQWKDAHREEYTRFAKMMADGNEVQYLAVCRAIFRQLPGIKKEWQMSWCDDSTDGFRNISLHFKENAVPGQIVKLYRKQREEDTAPPPSSFWGRMKYIFRQSLRKRCVTLSAPLVLSWLYYGKSFEAMVDMVSRQAGHPKAGNAERMGCSIVVRQIIEVSIKNGFRTQEDWDGYFAMKGAIEKGSIGEWALQSIKVGMGNGDTDTENNSTEAADSVTGTAPLTQRTAGKKKIQEKPLADYLKCVKKEAVIQCIRRFVSINTSAVHQALPFYVLKDLQMVAGMHAAKEYSVGMALQFPDLPSLKSESAIRQAVGFLKAAKHVIKDGKDQMAPLIESDENRELYRTLAAEIREIAADDEAETAAG